MAIYILTTNIILLSTLIAILTTTYDELRANAKTVWAWERFDIILEGILLFIYFLKYIFIKYMYIIICILYDIKARVR